MIRFYCYKCEDEGNDDYGPCVFTCPGLEREHELPRICPWEGSTNYIPNGEITRAKWEQKRNIKGNLIVEHNGVRVVDTRVDTQSEVNGK